MKKLLHTPLGWIIDGLARLPLGALYPLATALAWLMHSVVRYRRRVVDDNLRQCFPDRPESWRRDVARRFYRNFADYTVESIRLLRMSRREMDGRIRFTGMEHIRRATDSGQAVAAYFSHTFNWEWVTAMPLAFDGDSSVQFCQVYRPLRDAWFDSLMLRMRGRFGAMSLPKQTVLRSLLRLKADGKVTVTGFMSDQKPSHGDPTCPLIFLNRPTAMITGTETLARRLGMATVYLDLRRTTRGHYELAVLPMEPEEDGRDWPLTRCYARMLERSIMRDPSEWLWTHKRWKHPVEI